MIVRQAADDEVATSAAVFNDVFPREAVSVAEAEAFSRSWLS